MALARVPVTASTRIVGVIGDLVATLSGVADHLDLLYAIKQANPRSRFNGVAAS